MDEELAKAKIVEAASANLEDAQRNVARVAIELLDEASIDDARAPMDMVLIEREAWDELVEAAREWRDASEAFRRAVATTIPQVKK